MEHEFWLSRWHENKIGFHSLEVNPWLTKYLSAFKLGQSPHVLIPLCGKSEDIAYLAAQNMRITGVELSSKAATDFFLEQHLDFSMEQHGDFNIFHSENINIYQGDFFKLDFTQIAPVDLIYDRASLVALPAAMRTTYTTIIKQLCTNGSKMLLVSMDYPQDKHEGPPFAVSAAEIKSAYAGLKLELLAEKSITNEKKFSTYDYAKEQVWKI